MSDEDEKPFLVEIAKQGRAVCKKCRHKCVQGDLRIAKMVPNPVGTGRMKNWHHVNCIFEVFLKQRQTTKRIEGPQDLEGWDLLTDEDRGDILEKIKECNAAFDVKLCKTKKSKNLGGKGKAQLSCSIISEDSLSVSSDSSKDGTHKDNCFREFRTVVANVAKVNSSNEKINILRDTFSKGSDGVSFKGDLVLWCKLLLPAVIKRVFHLQTTQLVKLFSRIFAISEKIISEYLEQSDIGQTIQYFFEQNKKWKPAKKSILTIHEVDEFLETLTTLQKKDGQFQHFKSFIKKCTGNDLKVIIRLIKHDLRMNAGTKHVFEALHPNAYILFQSCRDLKTVINTCWVSPVKKIEISDSPKPAKRSPKRKGTTEAKPPTKKAKIEKRIPEPEETKKEEAIEERRKSVPNYFENIKLLLEEGVIEEHAEWVRYFIAFGGTVLKSDEYEEATHVLHLEDTIAVPSIPCPKTARHVIVEWIKDTVAKQNLQDWRPYTVRWTPAVETEIL